MIGMPRAGTGALLAASLLLLSCPAFGVAVTYVNGDAVIEAPGYRATFARDVFSMKLELRGSDGKWNPIAKDESNIAFGLMRGPGVLQANGLAATLAVVQQPDAAIVGRRTVLDPDTGLVLELHCICADRGILLGTRLIPKSGALPSGGLWSPPRITLVPSQWSAYSYSASDKGLRSGKISDLQPLPAYAGVSAWEQQGDTSAGFDPRRPGIILHSDTLGTGFGVVPQNYAKDWSGCFCFLQRYAADSLYLYAGYGPADRPGTRWAWLAPTTSRTPAEDASWMEKLVREGGVLLADFKPVAPAVPAAWNTVLPDFPAALRHAEPVRDIAQAAVFTINEGEAGPEHNLSVARKVGSDLLIRAWFKWNAAPAVSSWKQQPIEAHKFGALFGGGITCSALYDGENGLTPEQVRDMATRGPAGQMLNAWDIAGIRHGSLSSPAYLDYLFRWCREQIDAGVDYLFMDENTAALGGLEGYDDYSLADFRKYLLADCPLTRGWPADDRRWSANLGVSLNDPRVCPSGKMTSFDYRAHLAGILALESPGIPANKLFPLWGDFKRVRDDRAWKNLTDRIRAYGRSLGRTVLISANGIVPYVDLQVLGVWDKWTTKEGHIDLKTGQIPNWRSIVERGKATAGAKVPVVLFHDWGMGDTPFPWMAVPSPDRAVWMRTRGAEIYAAGGFFAFPVQGPFGCDASRDGTLPVIAHLTAYYQQNRDLYLQSRWLGTESVTSDAPQLSLAAGWHAPSRSLLIHAINRAAPDGVLTVRGPIRLQAPVGEAPESAVVVSPDFEGERAASCRAAGGNLEIVLPSLEAYSVVELRYKTAPDLSRIKDAVRLRLDAQWNRPPRGEFTVLPDGNVTDAADLGGFLQGRLHSELRNPPTFLVNAATAGQLQVHMRAVATAGAKLEYRVDGRTVGVVDLPDLDGKNDSGALEYDRTLSFAIPKGRHRVTLDNVGGDWALLEWYQFVGKFAAW